MSDQDAFGLSVGNSRNVYSVSGLNREARAAIEASLGTVWVEGEVSNLARPASGHLYFSLKDEQAQIRCAMFRQYGRRLEFALDNGQQVIVRARASIYEARGDFQLIVEYVENAGEGLLRRQFEALKTKLSQEGLFEPERKLPIPSMPTRIGVVTSPTGAAIQDVLTALNRRFPATDVLIYPSSVQGEGAAAELARTLRLADSRADCDLLILTRGGGSLEDLWAFNEEILARTISEVRVPIIVGVGHETDFTIADFIADLRAPTPSQAAELAVPDQTDWLGRIARVDGALQRAIKLGIDTQLRRLATASQRIQRAHPGVVIRMAQQRLDELEGGLARSFFHRIDTIKAATRHLGARIKAYDPRHGIALKQQLFSQVRNRLGQAAMQRLEHARHRLSIVARSLDALSPLATMERGYAIVTSPDTGQVVTHARALGAGDRIDVRLSDGQIHATVDDTEPANRHERDRD